jgi:hypothetical protein
MISVSLRARRLLPLAPQEPQVGNAALVEQEAMTLPLDHAFDGLGHLHHSCCQRRLSVSNTLTRASHSKPMLPERAS